jgi:hypothetical protein
MMRLLLLIDFSGKDIFKYQNVQKYLEDKNRMKELQILADDKSHIKHHL